MAVPPDPVWITVAHKCRQEGLPNPSSKPLGGGQKSFYYFAASGLVIGDRNGDGIADWVLELQNKPASLLVEDFLL